LDRVRGVAIAIISNFTIAIEDIFEIILVCNMNQAR